VTIRRIDTDDPEADAVSSMVDESFRYYGGPYWRWKYARSDGPPEVVIVADVDGEVVGCGHYLELPYSLGESGVTRGLAMGDLLVRPDRRGQGISTQISRQGRNIAIQTRPKAAIVVMFTRELGSHLRNLIGYTHVDADVNQWSKRLTWSRQLEQLSTESANLVKRHGKLASVDHVFRLELDGAPPLEFQVGGDGFRPGTDEEKSRFVVKTSESIVFGGGRKAAMGVLRGLLVGGFRVSGSWRAMVQAASVSGAYIDVLRILRS